MSDLTEASAPQTVYRPSPRPTYDCPTAIRYGEVTRHIWGDSESGEVTDWIYASTDKIHCLVFGLAPQQSFTHSKEFRTVFGADEVLEVLSGTLALANPETGEVVLISKGERVAFGPDTWHHGFAHGEDPLRVLELYAPPPSAGTSGAYARTRPFLEESTYGRADVLDGHLPTLRPISHELIRWERSLGVLSGVIAATDQLKVLTLEINPGEKSLPHQHGGDEILYVRDGTLWVRAWDGQQTFVFELEPRDACFIPAGAQHEYRNIDSRVAVATAGIAPA